MGWGGALFALSAVQAVSQVGQGYVEKAEAKYNATVLEGQAKMVDVQKEIEYGQYQRLKGKTWSTSIANIGGMGILPTGSPLAKMIDTQTQMNIDQAIGQFNLEREKNYTLSQAEAERRKGKMAVYSGWSRGFSTMLQGTSQFAMYRGVGQKSSQIKIDTDAGAKRASGGSSW